MRFIDKIRYRRMNRDERLEFLRKKGVKIGTGCEVFPEVEFGSEPYLIEIGNDVRITNGVKFVTHDGGVWVLRNMNKLPNADIFGKIIIGNNVHIGWNSIIMPNVTIGDNCIIGCGAVVTKDIPSNSVAVGVPARVIKTIEEYYEQNKEKADFTKHMNQEEKKKYLFNKYKL
ncbi:acyltransferase [uncultured Clostridium sp.]|uniref:acyltransferase n=1 Tax=uncultured Clostridium sp. TaxID=59620 RepID=UPI0025E0FBF8|nr:acyltransferase [uncultured Clostridium sp.]